MASTRVRPSSAAANLQTHPAYTSGLFDADLAARPVSRAGGRATRRPKTGGPRYWGRAGRTAAGAGRSARRRQRDRRVTLTGAEAVNDESSSLLTRQSLVRQKLNAELKVKVSSSSAASGLVFAVSLCLSALL